MRKLYSFFLILIVAFLPILYSVACNETTFGSIDLAEFQDVLNDDGMFWLIGPPKDEATLNSKDDNLETINDEISYQSSLIEMIESSFAHLIGIPVYSGIDFIIEPQVYSSIPDYGTPDDYPDWNEKEGGYLSDWTPSRYYEDKDTSRNDSALAIKTVKVDATNDSSWLEGSMTVSFVICPSILSFTTDDDGEKEYDFIHSRNDPEPNGNYPRYLALSPGSAWRKEESDSVQSDDEEDIPTNNQSLLFHDNVLWDLVDGVEAPFSDDNPNPYPIFNLVYYYDSDEVSKPSVDDFEDLLTFNQHGKDLNDISRNKNLTTNMASYTSDGANSAYWVSQYLQFLKWGIYYEDPSASSTKHLEPVTDDNENAPSDFNDEDIIDWNHITESSVKDKTFHNYLLSFFDIKDSKYGWNKSIDPDDKNAPNEHKPDLDGPLPPEAPSAFFLQPDLDYGSTLNYIHINITIRFVQHTG